jgi:hypothetical protein
MLKGCQKLNSSAKENNMIEELEVINNLNEYLYNNDLHESFQFYITTDGTDYFIELNEILKYGFNIQLFGPDFGFGEDVEEDYEENIISYKQAVRTQVLRNLKNIAHKFYDLHTIIGG